VKALRIEFSGETVAYLSGSLPPLLPGSNICTFAIQHRQKGTAAIIASMRLTFNVKTPTAATGSVKLL